MEQRKSDPALCSWEHVVAVPACREGARVLALLGSLESAANASGRALVVLVVNQREDSGADTGAGAGAGTSAEASALNLLTWNTVQEWGAAESGLGSTSLGGDLLLVHKGALSVLMLDRFRPGRGFPPKQGVGLARKISCDLASALIANGSVRNPVIFATDGDAQVPSDYFDLDVDRASRPSGSEALYNSRCPRSYGVFISPFRHFPVENQTCEQRQAIALYEAFLHYYVRGLARARSPYAFHTIGSTMSFHVEAYAKVRGFPKREAGEDFYLLNKLAKVAPVYQRSGGEILLEGRVSDRVPFGTGASVIRIADQVARAEPYLVYAPETFDILGGWLSAIGTCLETGEDVSRRFGEGIDPRLRNHLDGSGALNHFQRCVDRHQDVRRRRKDFFDWFDSFRTLKCVNAIRDGFVPPMRVTQPGDFGDIWS